MAELKYYTVEEAAEITGLSPITIRQYCREGSFPAAKVASRWIVSEENLKKYMAGQWHTGDPLL